tara:strand:+ start:1347 stop:1664 length:318 start_codon:yes stop_codon:yes gene_type:complete
MTLSDFKKLLQDRFRRIDSTFNSKQKEYANEIDVFENIKNGVRLSIFSTEPEQVAWSYAAKHLESIMSILEKLPEEEPSEELINEKIGDAINYLIIIEGLLKERK